jgi:deazaflavin-dependent oxidoreductase (nitroreductase family)
MRSDRLLLLTFTGRKSGKKFTTPLRYVQEGETLRMIVVYPWWRNLLGAAPVRVLLRGQMRTGTAEVLPEEDGEVVVKVHLNGIERHHALLRHYGSKKGTDRTYPRQ